MRTSVSIDPALCIGSTECNRIAASAFRLDEDRGVSLVLEGASEVDRALLETAARDCPTQAISLSGAEASADEGA